MDASDLRPEGFATEAEYRARHAEADSTALQQDFSEPKDYVLSERVTIADLRETVADLRSQVDVLSGRLAQITGTTGRLGKSAATWADTSAHEQLGTYPWAKLAGAFAATFVATRLLRMLPLGAMSSLAVPLVLRQVQGDRGRLRR